MSVFDMLWSCNRQESKWTMDEYLSHLFSSPAWSDANMREKSSWASSEPIESNVPLPCPNKAYNDDNRNSQNHVMESLTFQDTSSIILDGEPEFSVDRCLVCGDASPEHDRHNCNGNKSIDELKNGILKGGEMGLHYSILTPGSLNLTGPKSHEVVNDMRSSLSFNERGVVCNGSEPSVGASLRDFQTLSSGQYWQHPASFGTVSSLSSATRTDRIQDFGLQGGTLDNDLDTVGNRFIQMHRLLQLSGSPASRENQELQNYPVSSYATEQQDPTIIVGLPSLPEIQTTLATAAVGSNGTGKPRMRARRGQATDPHSIAERLRREKIAIRMRNLQELVPNSNKTDKASMLDEIIEYVKFLQLQVKVLSMSRLGAAGAVAPLITNNEAEGFSSLSLSASVGQGVDFCPTPDQIAFEQEVVKLMESNVTMAMQYLQTKGLCLMPIALAAAISSGKSSSSSRLAAEEMKTFGSANGLAHNHSSSSSSSNSSLPGIGSTRQMSPDGDIVVGKICSDGTTANCCNGALKLEDMNISRTAMS